MVAFPIGIANFVMVKVNDDLIYAIGGYQGYARNYEVSSDVWVIHPTKSFTVKKAPSLKQARKDHICSNIFIQNKASIICMGGFFIGNVISTVEYLIIEDAWSGWTIGMS